MAGAGLIGIKRRIKSVTNIRKITKAMGLVATAKLRKARVSLEIDKNHYNQYQLVMNDVVNSIEEKNLYVDGNKSKKKLYVILTSDSGLCGSFNASVINTSIDEINKDKDNAEVIVVGQKGRAYLKKLGVKTISEYVDMPNVPTIKEGRTITDNIINLYEANKVGEVYVVYSEFYSAVKQIVKTEKILPIERKKEKVSSNDSYVEISPESDKFLKVCMNNYIKANIMNFLFNSKASEHGSRMTAMNGSTDNANDLLDKLTLKFNRLRQSAITQEISEIVGGAEAQK